MSILVTALAAAVIVTPIVAIIALIHCGWKSLCWALVLSVAVAGAAWLCRGIQERDWRVKQQLHIRCAPMRTNVNRRNRFGDFRFPRAEA